MSTQTREELDLITHSPDGETRGLIFRIGDLFPMLPTRHILSAPATPASGARPWGLRFLAPLPIHAGKHEGATKKTSSSSPDGTAPEEVGSD
ncbi:hypothetical protein [Nonomuraea basaltis]|uniref:hypothetical protein n=1 Tax=Nonomuraea basaltis TaxID=2495887 RepID=UPI00110C40CA|nr:hypothetical protein [Nonomuraea basaltis]TMR92045.1 hypothetical protein EJK15_46770 [Nonomuraea basaltis]